MSLSRRALLKSAASATALSTLFPWTRALGAGPVRKLVLFFTPHGTVWPSWRPAGGEATFTFSPILEPLAAHRSKLAIVDGLSLATGTSYYVPHTYTMPVLWTGSPIDTAASAFCRTDHNVCFGWGTGISVDQAIAARLAPSTPFKTVELGTYCGGGHPANRMIYSAPRTPISPVDDPARAFSTLFATVDPSAAAAAARLQRRKSVLDTVVADVGSRKAALSADDRVRLDAHATAVRELEKRLQAETPANCTRPAAPTGVSSETAIDRQSDVLAASLGCGLTNIASVQLRIADNDNSLYPWVGLSAGGHHSLSHNSGVDAQAQLAKVYTWYSARFAYLLSRMEATPDPSGSGSVLDNTLVIWGSELGRAYDHNIANIPFIFAGGAGVGLRGGRYLKPTGLTHHRALVTAFHAMGLTDVQRYGALDTGNTPGPLPGLLAT